MATAKMTLRFVTGDKPETIQMASIHRDGNSENLIPPQVSLAGAIVMDSVAVRIWLSRAVIFFFERTRYVGWWKTWKGTHGEPLPSARETSKRWAVEALTYWFDCVGVAMGTVLTAVWSERRWWKCKFGTRFSVGLQHCSFTIVHGFGLTKPTILIAITLTGIGAAAWHLSISEPNKLYYGVHVIHKIINQSQYDKLG